MSDTDWKAATHTAVPADERAQLRALLQEVLDTMDYTDDAPGCAFCGVGFDPDCPDFPTGICHNDDCLIIRIAAALGEGTA